MFRRFRRFLTLIAIGDVLCTLAALALADFLRITLPWGKPLGEPTHPLVAPLIYGVVALVWPVSFQMLTIYDSRLATNARGQIRRLTVAVPVSVFVLGGFLYFTYREVPRLLVAYFGVLDWAFLVLIRIVAVALLRALRNVRRSGGRVLIVGAGDTAAEVARIIECELAPAYQVVGIVTDNEVERVAKWPILGCVAETGEVAWQEGCDEIIITLPADRHEDIERVVYELQAQPVHIHIIPDSFRLALVRARAETFFGLPMVGLREPVIDGVDWAIKRTFDLLLIFVVLPVALPLMGLIALAVKLDGGGPVLFRQERVGENGRRFDIIKFRTMVVGAERLQAQVAQMDAQGNPVYKTPRDPRVTRVGRFLRRWSIDELPQIFNVLRGEMSLVGPRPEQLFVVEQYEPWQRQRLAVPPGITGWWQVSGRSDLPMHLNTQYDLFYIRNYSLWLDLKILWLTAGVVVRGEGAY
jgi:exopolysaccharide biosynthesis polyprenyl glycosylphosphotransferase